MLYEHVLLLQHNDFSSYDNELGTNGLAPVPQVGEHRSDGRDYGRTRYVAGIHIYYYRTNLSLSDKFEEQLGSFVLL